MTSRIFLLGFLALLLGASRCAACFDDPPAVPPDPRSFIAAKSAAAPAAMAVDIACPNGDQDCVNAAAGFACTVSVGCDADGQCKFAPASTSSCPCFEGDIRWCSGGTSTAQFCAEQSAPPGSTAWQNACGPTEVACSTQIPDCDAGTQRTSFDTLNAKWSVAPGTPCLPTKSCPQEGEKQPCTPSDTLCRGERTYHLASGWSSCEQLPCVKPEICDGIDNDLDGRADNSIVSEHCHASAAGDCAAGRSACVSGRTECRPGAPHGESCDGRDNDCDGTADELDGRHNLAVNDNTLSIGGGLFGFSDNFLAGPQDCGGQRVSAVATKLGGGSSHCGVVDWANTACESNPNRVVGNSTISNACAVYRQMVNNGDRDCRYIIHVGVTALQGIDCQGSHVISVPNQCP